MKLPDNLQSCRVPVCGREIHYVRSAVPVNALPPVVLVHGIGLSHRYLVDLASVIADRLPVYVPDLPGFGKSYKPWRVQTLGQLGDWLAAWLQTLQLPPAGVFGQSFGGHPVVQLALRHPAHVASMVLQGMTVDPAARSLTRQFIRWRRNQRVEQGSKKNAPSAWPDYARCGLRRILVTYRWAIQARPEDVLPHITCPALVVRGELDPIVSDPWARQVAQRLPRGQLVTMSNLSHTINNEDPQALADLVVPFFAAHPVK